MAPARSNHNIGERLASLETGLADFKEYESKHWHKLDNDLTPIINLPAQIARDFGRLEGSLNGKIEAAVIKAITPIIQDIAVLRSDVDKLKTSGSQMTGARMVIVWVVQTLIAVVAAVASVLAIGHSR